MESHSSTVRRRAWINSSRQRPTVEETEPEGQPPDLPSASIADDDVFSEGCLTGKIEDWLLGCGSDARSVNTGQSSLESSLKANFDDDLSLGADASQLNGGETTAEAGLTRPPSFKQGNSRVTCSTPRRGLCPPLLNLGHSMASSCLSSSTCRTTSTVSEVLQLCAEDAEETLYELGFGCDEPQVTVRIPSRFFNFPSLVKGINFRLFLDSQLRRIREEDPSLSLASRFRQVQVLTAMANAFYSLYSHVSRTPLQKLATPEFTFSSSPVERFERFRGSVRSEPRSPVERLKDTVSKMCLYTGSPRGSGSTSPQPSPGKRSSLPDVVDIMLMKARTGNSSKKLDLGGNSPSGSAVDIRPIMDGEGGKEVLTQQTGADTDVLPNEIGLNKEMQDSMTEENGVHQQADYDSRTQSVRTSVASSLSGETVIEAAPQLLSCNPEFDLICSSQSDTSTPANDLKPVAKVTHDLICPQIVESVHQAPFCTHSSTTSTLPPICSETESSDISSHKPHKQTTDEALHTDSAAVSLSHNSTSPPVRAHDDSFTTELCITVTGWDEDDVSNCSLNAPDFSHSSAESPVQTSAESHNEGKSCYLNPMTHHGPGHDSSNLQTVNSFELEEVHSAGEEDSGRSETTTATSPLSKKHKNKGEVARGDSMQSDSSGYADEDVSPSSNTHSR